MNGVAMTPRNAPVRSEWRAVGARTALLWTAAFAIFSAAWIGCGLLLVNVLNDSWVGEADFRLAQWFVDHRTPDVVNLASIGATFSDTYTVIPAVLIAAVLFVILFRRWNETAFLLAAIVLEKAVFLVTTQVVGRERPPVEHLDAAPPTKSFTSGHVGAAVVLYGVCAVVVWLHTGRRSVRFAVVAVAIVVPIVVAASRMTQGMHYFTDVAAGAALGGACVAVSAWLMLPTAYGRRADARVATWSAWPSTGDRVPQVNGAAALHHHRVLEQ